CAAARAARAPFPPATRSCGSQRERKHERVLAPARRRVVAAAYRHLAKAVAVIELLRRAVARPHLQENVRGAERARKARRLVEERAAIAAALVRRGDREVEEMRFAHRYHEHEIADELAVQPVAAALVACAQGVGEIAARPGMCIDRLLDRQHLAEVLLH